MPVKNKINHEKNQQENHENDLFCEQGEDAQDLLFNIAV